MSSISTDSLQVLCLNYIASNLSKFTKEVPGTEGDYLETKLVFREPNFILHQELAEQLLKKLSKLGRLTDTILSLFRKEAIGTIRRACLRHANVSSKGLRSLSTQHLLELDATGLHGVNVNGIIGAQGEWTRKNLKALTVSRCTFMNTSKYCIVISLPQLKSLRHLDVSYTEFGYNLGLECVASDLPHLDSLDISGTLVYNIQPLLALKDSLKSLSMFKTRVPDKDLIPVVMEMHALRHLDISQDSVTHNIRKGKGSMEQLLCSPSVLPNMISMDISGRDDVTDEMVVHFVKCHPKLKFLGIALSHEICDHKFFKEKLYSDSHSDLKVAGQVTEEQILEALQRYKQRPNYGHKLLRCLFNMTQYLEKDPRPELVKAILPQMRANPKHLGVQMAASACLYNLTKNRLGESIHVTLLGKMVNLILHAMENFSTQQQLQKNALLTLCSDRILQEVNFDRYKASRMVMDCLFVFDDHSITRMAVAICSILAAKISTVQTTWLGTKRNMVKLLQIVKQKSDARTVDITLKFTLSALWNLTDESPATCAIFLNECGLDLFIDILETFKDEATLQTKVLGLINNIAEVQSLRHTLMRADFIEHCRNLLFNKQIEVSYFAAGIVAHLLHEGPEMWTLSEEKRTQLRAALHKSISGWQNPEGEMVAYRSFSPFFPLLTCYLIAEVQLWSVWAIHHVCSKNPSRYCPMLCSEGGVKILQDITVNPSVHKDVLELAKKVLSIVSQNTNTNIIAGGN